MHIQHEAAHIVIPFSYIGTTRLGLCSGAVSYRKAALRQEGLRAPLCAETVGVSMAGLVPILWGAGAGSEIMQRVAVPMIGGMAHSSALMLVVITRSIR
jgi:hypothetical protein